MMMMTVNQWGKKQRLESNLLSARYAVSNEIQKKKKLNEKKTHEININVQMSTDSVAI